MRKQSSSFDTQSLSICGVFYVVIYIIVMFGQTSGWDMQELNFAENFINNDGTVRYGKLFSDAMMLCIFTVAFWIAGSLVALIICAPLQLILTSLGEETYTYFIAGGAIIGTFAGVLIGGSLTGSSFSIFTVLGYTLYGSFCGATYAASRIDGFFKGVVASSFSAGFRTIPGSSFQLVLALFVGGAFYLFMENIQSITELLPVHGKDAVNVSGNTQHSSEKVNVSMGIAIVLQLIVMSSIPFGIVLWIGALLAFFFIFTFVHSSLAISSLLKIYTPIVYAHIVVMYILGVSIGFYFELFSNISFAPLACCLVVALSWSGYRFARAANTAIVFPPAKRGTRKKKIRKGVVKKPVMRDLEDNHDTSSNYEPPSNEENDEGNQSPRFHNLSLMKARQTSSKDIAPSKDNAFAEESRLKKQGGFGRRRE